MGFRDARANALAAKQAQEDAAAALEAPSAPTGMQYRVDALRDKLIGDHVGDGKLSELLNRRAGEGWLLKQVVPADVQGRVGPGGTGGLLVVFERQAP
jgi:hypothetical protein